MSRQFTAWSLRQNLPHDARSVFKRQTLIVMRMLSRSTLFLIAAWLLTGEAAAQPSRFTRADTLHGLLTPERACYDVTYYHLDIRIDPATKSIQGSNTIRFRTVEAFDRMQVDLFENLRVDMILFDDGSSVPFEREFNAVFLKLPAKVKKGENRAITVFYSGNPVVATRPPWDGGFIWEEDEKGNPWVAVTCQGEGASIWWPNKDHQSDEPDSMMISVTVPPGLEDVSNGRLRKKTTLPDGWTRFDWFVQNPINNYNVTVNIGKFAHFSDFHVNGKDTLTLDYYVMPYNLEKAKVQFGQVKPMMECFEKHFGKYPFYADGYKLVESPHLGMEHQSAVAYGNQYLQGYRGESMSAKGPSSPAGLKFDFIIIHETAHEWWGNSITAKDVADTWIHESFGAYAEAVYVECLWGYDEAIAYINAKRTSIENTEPITGVYNVHHDGSRDMYNKGQIALNTLRSVIHNDSLWWSIVHGLATTFSHQTLTADDVVNYINKSSGNDYTYFFNQYFRHSKIPKLDVFITRKGTFVTMKYKWTADVADFRMPVKVTTGPGKFEFIHPTTEWQTMTLGDLDPMQFKVADQLFYVDVKLAWSYVDPRKPD